MRKEKDTIDKVNVVIGLDGRYNFRINRNNNTPESEIERINEISQDFDTLE